MTLIQIGFYTLMKMNKIVLTYKQLIYRKTDEVCTQHSDKNAFCVYKCKMFGIYSSVKSDKLSCKLLLKRSILSASSQACLLKIFFSISSAVFNSSPALTYVDNVFSGELGRFFFLYNSQIKPDGGDRRKVRDCRFHSSPLSVTLITSKNWSLPSVFFFMSFLSNCQFRKI